MKRLSALIILVIASLCWLDAANYRFGNTKPPLGATLNWGHPLARGLVARWLMNERGGNAIDDISGANTGAFAGDVWWVGSDIALEGDVGDHINVGAGVNMAGWTELSVVFLASHDGSGTDEHCIASNWPDSLPKAAFILRFEPSDNTVEVFIVDAAGSTIGGGFADLVSIPNTIHHVAFSYDGTMRAYLDGVESSTTYTGNALHATASDVMHLGNSPHSTIDGLTGRIRSGSIYNRIPSAADIAWFYSDPYADIYSPLSAALYYQSGGAPPAAARRVILNFLLTPLWRFPR